MNLREWIDDLQSGMYINCVYCGHRYGPTDEEIPADALRRHIAKCSEHPMAHLVTTCKRLVAYIKYKEECGTRLSKIEEIVMVALQQAIKRAES